MSNPFLSFGTKDIATAKLYEKTVIADLEKIFHTNAPALTDGKQIYVNTEDNLFKTLPAYNIGMLKWLLWHEEQHLNLKHHDRFFNYLDELREADLLDKFQVTKDEVNIIMDILVHDSLCNWFPELIETAKANYAQLRNRNSLGYTFKTKTLEEMLDEYREFKYSGDGAGDGAKDEEDEDAEDTKDAEKDGKGEPKEDEEMTEEEKKRATDDKSKGRKKGHSAGDEDKPSKSKEKSKESMKDEDDPEDGVPSEHNDADWSELDKIDSKEFITEEEGREITRAVERIKRKKLKLARVTETLNGLATDQRVRTYAVPSRYQVGKGVILKGRKPGKAKLYLVFDASGSMNSDMDMFKEIIQKSIPQALECPCEWFSGWGNEAKLNYLKTYHDRSYKDYYKGKFKDFIKVDAYNGYGDDGDRVIDLCMLAEEKGFNPIGVTDGGGCIRFPDTLKKLKRTILVGGDMEWLKEAKKINPAVQTICTDEDEY